MCVFVCLWLGGWVWPLWVRLCAHNKAQLDMAGGWPGLAVWFQRSCGHVVWCSSLLTSLFGFYIGMCFDVGCVCVCVHVFACCRDEPFKQAVWEHMYTPHVQ